MPKYVCNNFGSCPAAGNVIELPLGAELVCPEDGYALEEVNEQNLKKPLVIGIGVAVVLAAIGISWLVMSPAKSPSTSAANGPSTATVSSARGMTPDAADQAKAKLGVDGKILAAGGSGALPDQKAVIAREYIKAAIPLLQAGKWQDADAQLLKAQNENPDEPLIYVNQAIIHLKQFRDKEALSDLETAFKKGFKDFGAVEGDTDLKPLTRKPEYAAMVAPFKSK